MYNKIVLELRIEFLDSQEILINTLIFRDAHLHRSPSRRDLNYSSVLPIQSFPALSPSLFLLRTYNTFVFPNDKTTWIFRNQLSIQLGKEKLNSFVRSQNESQKSLLRKFNDLENIYECTESKLQTPKVMQIS